MASPRMSIGQLKYLIAARRHLVMAAGVVGLSVLLVVLTILPQVGAVMTGYKLWQKEKPQLELLQQKVRELDAALVSPEFAQAETVTEVLPSKKPLLELLNSLSRAVAASSVRVETFEISPGLISTESSKQVQESKQKRLAAGYDSLDIDIGVSGTFDQVQQFMNLIEKISPFTTITSFALAEQGARTPGARELELGIGSATIGKTSLSLKTQSFFYTENLQVSLEKPLPKLTSADQAVLEQLASFAKIDLPLQDSVQGGGLEDLFKISNSEVDQSLLQ